MTAYTHARIASNRNGAYVKINNGLKQKIRGSMNIFDRINSWIRGIESSVVNLVSAIAPWLAPIAPAYMTYDHAVNSLHFPVWVAVPVAVVVEILGFSAVSTLLSFWFFNRRNRANAKKAPTGWVILAFGFYLALILSSNVLLDWFDNAQWALVAVRALFTLQTIPAAVIVIARVGHKDLLAEIAAEREESKRKVSEEVSTPEESLPVTYPPDWRKLRTMITDEQVKSIAVDQTKNIAFHYKVSERTARNWRTYAQEEIRNKAQK